MQSSVECLDLDICLEACYCCLILRWDAAKPAGVDNLVLMTFQEADQHDNGSTEATNATEAHRNYVHERLQLIRTEYNISTEH